MEKIRKRIIAKRFLLVLCFLLLAGGVFSFTVSEKKASAKKSYATEIKREKKLIKKYKKQLKKAKQELKKAKSDWKKAPKEGTSIFSADVINGSPLIIHSTNVLSEGKGYYYIKNKSSSFSSTYSGTVRVTGGTYNYHGTTCKVAVEIRTKRQKAAGRELRAYAKVKRIRNKINSCRSRIRKYNKMSKSSFKLRNDSYDKFLNGDTITLCAEKSLNLYYGWGGGYKGTVNWTIADESLLEIVEKNDGIRLEAGKNCGTTVIKGKVAESGKVIKYNVVIQDYPTSITASQSNITLKVGEKKLISWSILPETAAKEVTISYKSDYVEVNEIYSDEIVTACESISIVGKAAGESKITIKSKYTNYSEASTEIHVTVLPNIEGFDIGGGSDSPATKWKEIALADLQSDATQAIPYLSEYKVISGEYNATYSEASGLGYYDLKYSIDSKANVNESITAYSTDPAVAFPIKTKYCCYRESENSTHKTIGHLRIGVAGEGRCDIVMQSESGATATWHLTFINNEIEEFSLDMVEGFLSEIEQEILLDELTDNTELIIPNPQNFQQDSSEYSAVYSEDTGLGYYDLEYGIWADGKCREEIMVESTNTDVAFPVATKYAYFEDYVLGRYYNSGCLRIAVAGEGSCDIIITSASGASAIWHITVSENYITSLSFQRGYSNYLNDEEHCYTNYESLIELYKGDEDSGFSETNDEENYFEVCNDNTADWYIMIPYTYETANDSIYKGIPDISCQADENEMFIKFIQCNRVLKKGYICLGLNKTEELIDSWREDYGELSGEDSVTAIQAYCFEYGDEGYEENVYLAYEEE